MAHGGARKGAGRKAGATSKEIKQAREAISKFCDANSDKIQTWFDLVAKENPEKALEILYKYLEFHVPKLSRVDNNTTLDGNLKLDAQVNFIGGSKLPDTE